MVSRTTTGGGIIFGGGSLKSVTKVVGWQQGGLPACHCISQHRLLRSSLAGEADKSNFTGTQEGT
jgi:hypothetical protein